jgi:hypothetical protein
MPLAPLYLKVTYSAYAFCSTLLLGMEEFEQLRGFFRLPPLEEIFTAIHMGSLTQIWISQILAYSKYFIIINCLLLLLILLLLFLSSYCQQLTLSLRIFPDSSLIPDLTPATPFELSALPELYHDFVQKYSQVFCVSLTLRPDPLCLGDL